MAREVDLTSRSILVERLDDTTNAVRAFQRIHHRLHRRISAPTPQCPPQIMENRTATAGGDRCWANRKDTGRRSVPDCRLSARLEDKLCDLLPSSAAEYADEQGARIPVSSREHQRTWRIGRTIRSHFALLAATMLVACGGGGGTTSGGGGGGDPPPGTEVPMNPPTLPVISYAGTATAANISDTNVGALADVLWDAVFVALRISNGIYTTPILPGETLDQTQSGPAGGSVRFTARTAQDGTGWISAELSGYRAEGLTWTGRQVIETLQLPSGTNNQTDHGRISLYGLRVQGPRFDLTYDGWITREIHAAASDRVVTGSVLVRENVSGWQLYAENLSITRTDANDGTREIAASGRSFDARYGYVDFQSEQGWFFKVDELFPHHGGAIRATGGDGRYLRLAPLTSALVVLEYVGQGASAPTRSVRLAWDPSFEAQTLRAPLAGPVADAGASSFVQPGTQVQLDGRFSDHPQTNLLGFHWELLFRPPGSTAALNSATATQPRLTLDIEGRYIISLEVNDGQRTARDVIVLTADPGAHSNFEPVKAQLPPDEVRTSGDPFEIVLDRVTPSGFLDPTPLMSFYVEAPTGFPASTIQTAPGRVTVSPTGPGVYTVTVSRSDLSGERPNDVQWVAVDAPMPFSPSGTALLEGSGRGGIAAADLNRDGFTDIVASNGGDGVTGRLLILRGNAAGYLDPPLSQSIGRGGSVAIGDLNGDQRADIVLNVFAGILLFRQQADGSFGSPQMLTRSCSGADDDSDLIVADLNADGRQDILSVGCSQVDYFFQSSNGALLPPVTVDPGVSLPVRATAGDVTGDGIADVVVVGHGGPGLRNVAIIRGVANGNPATPVLLPYEAASLTPSPTAPVVVADLNADGRMDIITGENPISDGIHHPAIVTFLQDATGSMQAAQLIETGTNSLRIVVADLNRDGRMDIARSRYLTGGFDIHYGMGGEKYSTMITDRRPGPGAFPEVFLDLNRDGTDDFAYLAESGNTVLVGVAFGLR